jgi:hypothetical protein
VFILIFKKRNDETQFNSLYLRKEMKQLMLKYTNNHLVELKDCHELTMSNVKTNNNNNNENNNNYN